MTNKSFPTLSTSHHLKLHLAQDKKLVRWQTSSAAKVRENNNDPKDQEGPPVEDIL